MNGSILQYAGSLIAVIAIVAIAYWLRLGGEPEIADEAEARELADNAICGFDAVEVALDRSGRSALLRERDGRIMLLAPHGNHFVARLLNSASTARLHDNRLEIRTGDGRTGAVLLDVPDPAAWCRAIGGLD